MARPTKRKVPGGGNPRSERQGTSKRTTPQPSTRYTPPVPQSVKVSPRWLPVVIFGLAGLGVAVIIANYLGFVPGGEADNWYLLVGLGFILAGILAATQWH